MVSRRLHQRCQRDGGSDGRLALVACVLEMSEAVPATCLVAVTLAVYVAWMYRAHSRVAPIIPMLLGCIPGLIIGVCVLRVVPGIWLQGGLGAALIVYVAWQLLHRAGTAHPESVRGCAVSGFASGFANAAISFSGPPVAIYALYVGWDKDTTRGTLSLYFLGISICTCIVQAAAGLYTPVVVKAALWGMPGALVGLGRLPARRPFRPGERFPGHPARHDRLRRERLYYPGCEEPLVMGKYPIIR